MPFTPLKPYKNKEYMKRYIDREYRAVEKSAIYSLCLCFIVGFLVVGSAKRNKNK